MIVFAKKKDLSDILNLQKENEDYHRFLGNLLMMIQTGDPNYASIKCDADPMCPYIWQEVKELLTQKASKNPTKKPIK